MALGCLRRSKERSHDAQHLLIAVAEGMPSAATTRIPGAGHRPREAFRAPRPAVVGGSCPKEQTDRGKGVRATKTTGPTDDVHAVANPSVFRARLERLREEGHRDPALQTAKSKPLLGRATVVTMLSTMARTASTFKEYRLGTWGSGSLDIRAKELVKELPRPLINPWPGREFSKAVLLVAVQEKAQFDTADALLDEYMDVFWAIVLPYECVRAQALQRFQDQYIPKGMFNALGTKIRDNSLKNGEGPALRSWVLTQLGNPADLIALVDDEQRDYAALNEMLAARVRSSLPDLRATGIFRQADLDRVEESLPGPSASAAPTSRVRPELLCDLADELDGPFSDVSERSDARPLSEWGPRFCKRALSALKTRRGAGVPGLKELADDAWTEAQLGVIASTPRSEWRSLGTDDDQAEPWVTFESLTQGQALWRSINAVLPRNQALSVAAFTESQEEDDSFRSPYASTTSDAAHVTIDQLADQSLLTEEESAGADVIVLRELIATMDEYVSGVDSGNASKLHERLEERIKKVADDLRQCGRIRGRVNVAAVHQLLEVAYRQAARRNVEEGDDQDMPAVARQLIQYRCPLGHTVHLTFAADAVAPPEWDCRVCDQQARLLPDAVDPAAQAEEVPHEV